MLLYVHSTLRLVSVPKRINPPDLRYAANYTGAFQFASPHMKSTPEVQNDVMKYVKKKKLQQRRSILLPLGKSLLDTHSLWPVSSRKLRPGRT